MFTYNKLTYLTPGMTFKGYKHSDPFKVRIYQNDIEKDFFRYSCMFHKAGEQIAVFLLDPENTNIHQLDTFVFPLTFIYRHSIELLLKAIGFKCIPSMVARKDFITNTFHNLKSIFDVVEDEYTVVLSDDEKEWVKNFLLDISRFDAASDSFRYPYHIKIYKDVWDESVYSLERVFDERLNIDLRKLVLKFESVYEILFRWYSESETSLRYFNKSLSPKFLDEGGDYYSMAVVGYAWYRV